MAEKNIRLDSRFSIIGAFWPPGAPDPALTGTLTSDERQITLTTAPEHNRQPSMKAGPFPSGDSEVLPVLHGFTQDGQCTLCGLVEHNSPSRIDFPAKQSIKATSYRVSSCVMGMCIDGLTDKCLNSAKYTFTGLSEWLPRSFSETWLTDSIVLTVPLEPKDILAFGLCTSHVEVAVKLISELTSSEGDGGRLSRSIVCVEIRHPKAESLSWYVGIGDRLENLFSLLTGGSVAMETMFVYRGEESASVITKWINHTRSFDRLQCVYCTPSQLANSIAIWLCQPQRFSSIEGLALGVLRKAKLFIETEFLSLAQALEGLHRATTHTVIADRAKLRQVRKQIRTLLEGENIDAALKQRLCESMGHATEPTLALRLGELCSRISFPTLSAMEIDPVLFVKNVRVTRNFYTHAGTSDSRSPVQGKDLFLLNQKMRALLRGVLLLHLGIPEEKFAAVLSREATRWR